MHWIVAGLIGNVPYAHLTIYYPALVLPTYMMKLALPKVKHPWILKIGVFFGIFLLSIVAIRPNPIFPVENLALDQIPEEWFQSPSKNFTFSSEINIISLNSDEEDLSFYQDNSIYRFNMTSKTSERFLADHGLFPIYKKNNILCGVGNESYHFYHYDTMLKVKEISIQVIHEVTGGFGNPGMAFASSNVEFLGVIFDSTIFVLHQASEGGSWSKVHEISFSPWSYDKKLAYSLNENCTEIWETGQNVVNNYVRKYSWDGVLFLLEESFEIETDPLSDSEACHMNFISVDGSQFALKLTDTYYRTINCSNFETSYGILELSEWYTKNNLPPQCSFATRQDGGINVLITIDASTTFLTLPLFPNASHTYTSAHSLPPGSVQMASNSDYLFIHRLVFAAEYGPSGPMTISSVYQHFFYCYQISTSAVIWWWSMDDTQCLRDEIRMYRSNDQMFVKYLQLSRNSLNLHPDLMLVFDIPAIGSGDPQLNATFPYIYPNYAFIGINLIALLGFLYFLLRNRTGGS